MTRIFERRMLGYPMWKQSRLKIMETRDADVETCRNNIRGKPVSPTHPGSHHVGTLNGGPIAPDRSLKR